MGSIASVQKMMGRDEFKPGSIVLVQGASSGLGWQIALKYAQRQCPMVVSARNEAKLTELVQICEKEFGNTQVVYKVAEASNENDCKQLIEFTLEKFGQIDILVLAAGVAAHTSFRNFESLEIPRQIMDVNFWGQVYMTKHALPHLRNSKGQILVMSSLSGEIGLAQRTIYVAAKSAVNIFFRTLSIEEEDITVSLMVIDSFSGSNFRNNSLVQADQLEDRKKLSVDEVCELIMIGADRKVKVTFIPSFISLLYGIRTSTLAYTPSLWLKFMMYKVGQSPKL